MMTRPARAGMATHRAVSISGAARCRLFCHENQSPNAPLNSSTHTSSGLTPANATSRPNTSSAAAMASTGSAMSLSVSRMAQAVETSDGAVDAFHQVVHLLQFQVGLAVHLAGRDHHIALVV